jgi:hypothetical protein
MSLLHVLTGLRTGRRGVRDGSGMLLIMLALSGLLTNKATKRDKGPCQRLTEQRWGAFISKIRRTLWVHPFDRFGSR